MRLLAEYAASVCYEVGVASERTRRWVPPKFYTGVVFVFVLVLYCVCVRQAVVIFSYAAPNYLPPEPPSSKINGPVELISMAR